MDWSYTHVCQIRIGRDILASLVFQGLSPKQQYLEEESPWHLTLNINENSILWDRGLLESLAFLLGSTPKLTYSSLTHSLWAPELDSSLKSIRDIGVGTELSDFRARVEKKLSPPFCSFISTSPHNTGRCRWTPNLSLHQIPHTLLISWESTTANSCTDQNSL